MYGFPGCSYGAPAVVVAPPPSRKPQGPALVVMDETGEENAKISAALAQAALPQAPPAPPAPVVPPYRGPAPGAPPAPVAPPAPAAPPAAPLAPADANAYGVQAAMDRVQAQLAVDPLQASQELDALRALFAQERPRYRDPALLRAHEARMQLLEAQVDVEVSNLQRPPAPPVQSPYPGL